MSEIYNLNNSWTGNHDWHDIEAIEKRSAEATQRTPWPLEKLQEKKRATKTSTYQPKLFSPQSPTIQVTIRDGHKNVGFLIYENGSDIHHVRKMEADPAMPPEKIEAVREYMFDWLMSKLGPPSLENRRHQSFEVDEKDVGLIEFLKRHDCHVPDARPKVRGNSHMTLLTYAGAEASVDQMKHMAAADFEALRADEWKQVTGICARLRNLTGTAWKPIGPGGETLHHKLPRDITDVAFQTEKPVRMPAQALDHLKKYANIPGEMKYAERAKKVGTVTIPISWGNALLKQSEAVIPQQFCFRKSFTPYDPQEAVAEKL